MLFDTVSLYIQILMYSLVSQNVILKGLHETSWVYSKVHCGKYKYKASIIGDNFSLLINRIGAALF